LCTGRTAFPILRDTFYESSRVVSLAIQSVVHFDSLEWAYFNTKVTAFTSFPVYDDFSSFFLLSHLKISVP